MIHFGDVTKIKGNEVPAVDVITFGAPCQDLSVAGKRKGMKHEEMGDDETTRSGLFFEATRIIKEMRNAPDNDRRMARFAIYENVYGAFSSNKGEDFRAVLEELVRIKDKDAHIPGPPKDGWPHAGYIMGDGYSIAWRGHDAQYWGVPQRRKRVCVLADFDGDTAPKILFETELWRETDEGDSHKVIADIGAESRPEVQSFTEGVSGNFEPGGKERQGVAGDIEESVGASSYTLKVRGGVEYDSKGRKAGKGALVQEELSGTLGVSQDQTLITGCLNSWDVQSKHIQTEDGVAESLYSGECRYGGGESYVMQQPVLLESNQNHATIQTDGVSTSLPASMGMGGGYVPMITEPIYAVDEGAGKSKCNVIEDVSPTLATTHRGEPVINSPVCFEPGAASRVGGHCYSDGIAGTVRADAGDNQQAIAYGIGAYDSNAMKSSNPNSGIYEAETTRTLDINGGNPACNQGGMAVVYRGDAITSPVNASNPQIGDPCHTLTDDDRNYLVCIEGNGARESHKGDGYKESDTMYTLNTVEQHAVAYGLDRASFNQGRNAQFGFSVIAEQSPTITAKGPGGVLQL